MNNIGTLYAFELKKILKSRLTIVMLVILFASTVIEAFAPGSSEINDREMAAAMHEIDGRKIDDELLHEMYPIIDEHGDVWDESNMKYFGAAYVERNIVGRSRPLAEYSAAELYARREEDLFAMMEQDVLTEQELAYWRDVQKRIDKPFTYYYFGGALLFMQGLIGICSCVLILSAMCVSTVFTSEHRNRTDQVVLSCVNGRMETYYVKMAAGLTVVVGSMVLAVGVLALIIHLRYGIEGLNAIVQLEVPLSGYDMTMGQFISTQLMLLLAASILFAVFAMAASELLKNSLAVMGTMIGVFVLGQIEFIPPELRVLSQVRSMLPSNQISPWSLMEHRLINIGGQLFTGFAVSPVIYLAVSVLFVIAGGIIYNRFQVTGR